VGAGQASAGAGGVTVGTGGGGGSGGANTGGCTGAGGQGGAIDPLDPCGSLTQPGADPFRVAWVTRPDPIIEITTGIELLWGLQYAVTAPLDERAGLVLEHERCERPAGTPEQCWTFGMPLPADTCEVAFAPKYGIDPSQYNPGENVYRFAMRLRRGCSILSEDIASTTVVYMPAP
jgi:hypothetical protein